MSNNWVYKNRFGRPDREAKYCEKKGFVAGVLLNAGKDLNVAVTEALFTLYNMCQEEWVPMFRTDSRYIRQELNVFDKALQRDRFDSDMDDAGKLLLFGSRETGMVGYLMVTDRHYIESLYVLPEYRKDGIAHSLLELYINRFDAPELTVTPYTLDTNAISFFKNLGFEETSSGLTVDPVPQINVNLIWRAKP